MPGTRVKRVASAIPTASRTFDNNRTNAAAATPTMEPAANKKQCIEIAISIPTSVGIQSVIQMLKTPEHEEDLSPSQKREREIVINHLNKLQSVEHGRMTAQGQGVGDARAAGGSKTTPKTQMVFNHSTAPKPQEDNVAFAQDVFGGASKTTPKQTHVGRDSATASKTQKTKKASFANDAVNNLTNAPAKKTMKGQCKRSISKKNSKKSTISFHHVKRERRIRRCRLEKEEENVEVIDLSYDSDWDSDDDLFTPVLDSLTLPITPPRTETETVTPMVTDQGTQPEQEEQGQEATETEEIEIVKIIEAPPRPSLFDKKIMTYKLFRALKNLTTEQAAEFTRLIMELCAEKLLKGSYTMIMLKNFGIDLDMDGTDGSDSDEALLETMNYSQDIEFKEEYSLITEQIFNEDETSLLIPLF